VLAELRSRIDANRADYLAGRAGVRFAGHTPVVQIANRADAPPDRRGAFDDLFSWFYFDAMQDGLWLSHWRMQITRRPLAQSVRARGDHETDIF
jgi:hypothetical protein